MEPTNSATWARVPRPRGGSHRGIRALAPWSHRTSSLPLSSRSSRSAVSETASLLREHQDAVQRLAEVPGLGVDSAQQIIAEVGAKAATFASAKNLVSWVGACPGEDETAGVNRSKRSPKGNRQMRRILNQAANAAVKHKGSIFEIVYRRFVPRLGHNKTIGAIAHRLCQLIWIILHKRVRYEERGPSVCEKAKRVRTSRMIRTLRALGYRVEPAVIPA
jgi:transposase